MQHCKGRTFAKTKNNNNKRTKMANHLAADCNFYDVFTSHLFRKLFPVFSTKAATILSHYIPS